MSKQKKSKTPVDAATTCSPSSTPETTAFLESLWNPDIHRDFEELRDFARKMERERDDWRDAEAAANRCFARANQQVLTLRACLEYIANAGISARHCEDEAQKALDGLDWLAASPPQALAAWKEARK